MPHDDDLDALDRAAGVLEPLPSDPWAAVVALARMQADDAVLEAVLVADYGLAEDTAGAMIEERHDELVLARRAGQATLIRRAHAALDADTPPPAAAMLRLLVANHVGWTGTGIDADMRKLRRQLERMTPAERAAALAEAASLEGAR